MLTYMDEERVKHFIADCTVVLSAGGESSRFRSVAGADGVQKSAFVLPNGETMIERTVALYKSIGITDFVILVYHNADSIRDLLGDGSRFSIRIAYSEDPGRPVGRGGAIKHAVNRGLLTPERYLIAHNPDDQLVGDAKKTLLEAIEAHICFEQNNTIATAVMVGGVRHEFTGFKIEEGRVTEVEMYPFIHIPTHIGMTIFSPAVLSYFDTLFDLSKKTDFEAVLFPELVKEGKLAAHIIPEGAWISVNDGKGLKKLIDALQEKE